MLCTLCRGRRNGTLYTAGGEKARGAAEVPDEGAIMRRATVGERDSGAIMRRATVGKRDSGAMVRRATAVRTCTGAVRWRGERRNYRAKE